MSLADIYCAGRLMTLSEVLVSEGHDPSSLARAAALGRARAAAHKRQVEQRGGNAQAPTAESGRVIARTAVFAEPPAAGAVGDLDAAVGRYLAGQSVVARAPGEA